MQAPVVRPYRQALLRPENRTEGFEPIAHSKKKKRAKQVTHHGHLLIFLHAPSLEEALSDFVYREDQLAAYRTCVNSRAGVFEVANSRLCRTTQPGEAKDLVFRTAPAMPQCEPPH